MRVLDTKDMRVVHAGLQWPYADVDPSTKEAMKFLERNEALVTWVQPIGSALEEQIPTIHVRDDVYYVLSLRCMKIVFRHIRLCKGFVNREKTVFGEWKLRIPMCLLREKIRTQMRFNVLCAYLYCVMQLSLCISIDTHARVQALRRLHMGDQCVTQAANAKASTSAVQKIITFVNDNVLNFDEDTDGMRGPLSFMPREPDTLNNMLDLVQSECPRLLRSSSYFISKVEQAYAARYCVN